MKRLRNVVLLAISFALGWWIIAQLLEWMSPKPVPAEGMRTADVHPYEMTPGATPAVETPDVAGPVEEETDEQPAEASAQHLSDEPAEEEAPQVYCLRCREKRTVVHWHYETTDRGRRRLVGECSVCGGGVSQFVKSE